MAECFKVAKIKLCCFKTFKLVHKASTSKNTLFKTSNQAIKHLNKRILNEMLTAQNKADLKTYF